MREPAAVAPERTADEPQRTADEPQRAADESGRFDCARGLVWFRRDLRVDDHAALHHALSSCREVFCVFVFDREILDALQERADRRVEFILACVTELDAELRALGGGLHVLHDRSREAIPRLAAQLDTEAVFVARDYEPAAVDRDDEVARRLAQAGRRLLRFKDQVVFDTDEVLTGSRRPFSVFTPYRTAWQRRLEALGADGRPGTPLAAWPVRELARRLAKAPLAQLPTLASLGFVRTNLAPLQIPTGARGAAVLFEEFIGRIGRYQDSRDYPALKGPSYLSVHLRFGTISIRRLARAAWQVARADPQAAAGARTWLSELVWREFYVQVLHHHPRVVGASFRPEYDAIRWETGPQADALFAAWCEARTGYPLVDAAMLQINRTGYMHNRLRMVVASFLVKDLGIDWRRGERYFAQRLNDFDLAANNGGWQWSASSGCDAQPWFRIFNPVTQSQRFDPRGAFIRRYLPQLAGLSDRQVHAPWLMTPDEQARDGCVVGRDYPAPIVDHASARARTLQRYAVVKAGGP